MRIFWIVILLLGAVALLWSWWPAPSSERGPAAMPETSGADAAVRTAASREDATPTETTPQPAGTSAASAPLSTLPAPAPVSPPLPSGESASPPSVDASATAETLDLGLDRTIPDAAIVKGSIVRGPRDILLADDRFEIEGEGTRENPYRVSWELLVSAGESYRPRVGDRGIPQRIAMLDGQWVAIDGYVAFPMLVGTATEALVMLNRWDGCCIGVPPSPYDAIEVKLDRPVVRTQMHAIDYGSVTGILEVEPYLVDDWLVGLYLMEDAALRLDL